MSLTDGTEIEETIALDPETGTYTHGPNEGLTPEEVAEREVRSLAESHYKATEGMKDARFGDQVYLQLQEARTPADFAEILAFENPGQYGSWASLLDILKAVWAPIVGFLTGDAAISSGLYYEKRLESMYRPTAESMARDAGYVAPEDNSLDRASANLRAEFPDSAADRGPDFYQGLGMPNMEPNTRGS